MAEKTIFLIRFGLIMANSFMFVGRGWLLKVRMILKIDDIVLTR